MPRKSLRTATTTYRRRQLTWDDAESCTVNLDDDDYSKVSKLSTTSRKTRGRFVTPSPLATSTSGRIEKNASPQKRPPRRKQLFPKGKTSMKKSRSTAAISGCSSVIDSHRKGHGWSGSRKRPINAASKVVVSKAKSGRSQKRKHLSGDSLATFFSSKKAFKTSDRNTTVTKLTKNDHRKGPQRHSIGTKENNEKSERFSSQQTSYIPTTPAAQNHQFEKSEKNFITSTERKNERTSEKEKKSVPPELISLLTSRRKKRVRRTKARSTLEILDEFKKELKSKEGMRASLPRACKRSTESLVNEGSNGDSESEPENKYNDDGDSTEVNPPSQMKDYPTREILKRASIMAEVSSINKSYEGLNASPPATTLKPRQRKRLRSSVFGKTQSLLRLVSPSLNDDCESDAYEGGLMNQQSHYSDSLQQVEIKISSPKANPPGSISGRNNNSAFTNENVKKTLLLDSEEQVPMHSRHKRRRRIMHGTNVFDASNSGDPPSNSITNIKVSPRQGSQQIWQKPSYYRRTKQPKKYYPLHSRDSKNKKLMAQSCTIAANSSPRVMTRESYEGAIAVASKNPSNSSVLRRGSQQLRQQPYSNSNSPTKLVSLSNGESRTHQSPSRGKQHLVSSPRRKKEQQLLKHRKSDNEGSSSKKRVRFDSSTTTFSVKIKIKTNLDTSSQDQNGSDYSQSVPFSPSLDQSAVQAIANQVTQACLTQARTGAGNTNGSIIRTCEDSVVNVDVDVNDDEFSSHSSSNSNQSNDDQEELGDGNREIKLLHGMFGERNTSIVDARPEVSFPSRKNFDDGRSITSELTSDWNRPRSSIFNDQNQIEKRRQQQEYLLGEERSIRKDSAWDDRFKTDQGAKIDNVIENTHFDYIHDGPAMSNAMRPPRAISKPQIYEEMRSHSSISRRQRMRGCCDSLAGSTSGSIASAVEGDISGKIPRTVSLGKPSTGLMGCRSSWKKFEKMKYTPTIRRSDKAVNREIIPERSVEREVDSTRILPIVPNTVKNAIVTDANCIQNTQEAVPKTMKAPWAEGDDWTVDYSYLSEPEYRRPWGNNLKSLLSTRSLSTPRLPVHKKQSIGLFGGAGRTSLSSVSESIVSQKRSKKILPPLSTMPNNQPSNRRRGGGKRKRDPLHGIALPRTSTDACSVTSWRENRKCLRALMEYDEADQDWV